MRRHCDAASYSLPQPLVGFVKHCKRRRKYTGRFHLLAAWEYGIMLEPGLLSWEPPVLVWGQNRSRTGC